MSDSTSGAETPAGDEYERLSVNVSAKTAADLWEMAARHGSITEAVRRAVAVLKFAGDEVAAGNRLAVLEPGGGIRKVNLL